MKRVYGLIGPILFFIAFAGETAAFQQDKSSTYRPKIGLVLSGGGAKGMAHVGVIRAMEKAEIRPEYIVGTSMGSVFGGLSYAIAARHTIWQVFQVSHVKS